MAAEEAFFGRCDQTSECRIRRLRIGRVPRMDPPALDLENRSGFDLCLCPHRRRAGEGRSSVPLRQRASACQPATARHGRARLGTAVQDDPPRMEKGSSPWPSSRGRVRKRYAAVTSRCVCRLDRRYRWQREEAPMNADAVVIGAGQAAVPLAVKLAKSGRRTVLVERSRLGGTCVNYGCTPTKTMVASARAAHVALTSRRPGGGARTA